MDQRKAAQKVLSALDYALILGMPGINLCIVKCHSEVAKELAKQPPWHT